jgi:hypothetical protein
MNPDTDDPIITRSAFEALATTHGFDTAHHEAGVYELFRDSLREALEETIAAAMVSIPVTEADAHDLPLGEAVRKRMRVYIWPACE